MRTALGNVTNQRRKLFSERGEPKNFHYRLRQNSYNKARLYSYIFFKRFSAITELNIDPLALI